MAYDIGYRPPEILVPVVQHLPGIGTIPTSLTKKVGMGLMGHEQVSEATYAVGRGAKPSRSMLLYNEDSKVLTIILADGQTEMAEMEDLAHEVIERNEKRAREGKRGMDFDALRQRAGAVAREKASANFQEAIQERIRRHKANPVTDPFRQFKYTKDQRKQFFMMGGSSE